MQSNVHLPPQDEKASPRSLAYVNDKEKACDCNLVPARPVSIRLLVRP